MPKESRNLTAIQSRLSLLHNRPPQTRRGVREMKGRADKNTCQLRIYIALEDHSSEPDGHSSTTPVGILKTHRKADYQAYPETLPTAQLTQNPSLTRIPATTQKRVWAHQQLPDWLETSPKRV